MILEKVILHIYPDAIVHRDFVVVLDDNDNQVIQQWNYEKYPEMPTQEQLDEAWKETFRKMRFDELTETCDKEILGYFEATVRTVVFLFSFDAEAQQNFNGALSFFTEGLITEVEWTAHRDGIAERIVMNKAEFLPVVQAAFFHKNSKIHYLRNVLQPQLEAAKTVQEMEAVVW